MLKPQPELFDGWSLKFEFRLHSPGVNHWNV